MALRRKLLVKLGKKLGTKTSKRAMTPARKRALAKAVKASAAKRRGAVKGAVSKVKPGKINLSGATRKAKLKPAGKAKLQARKLKLKARGEKYWDKAEKVERNIHGSILDKKNKLNIGRRIKLGHYARKSRRLENQSKRVGNRLKRR